MAPTTRLLLPLLLLLPTGCLQPTDVEYTAPISCRDDRQCPEGYFCAPNPKRCANESSDLDPPRVLSGMVLTGRVPSNGTIEARITTDEELSDVEAWYVRGADVVYLNPTWGWEWEGEGGGSGTGGAGGSEGFTYEINGTAGEGDGPAKVMAVPRDSFGNRGQLAVLGTFTLDNDGPGLVESDDPPLPAISHRPASRGTTVSFFFMADEPLRTEPVVFVDLDSGTHNFAFAALEAGIYKYQLTVPQTAATGSYSVFVFLVDTLSNEAGWEIPDTLVIQ